MNLSCEYNYIRLEFLIKLGDNNIKPGSYNNSHLTKLPTDLVSRWSRGGATEPQQLLVVGEQGSPLAACAPAVAP